MIASTKSLARRILPQRTFQALRKLRWHNVIRLAKLTDHRVLAGPFAGMRYSRECIVPFSSSGGVLQKLIGAYEHQCHPVIEKALRRGYSRIINIGAGEGYYAVGFGLRLAETGGRAAEMTARILDDAKPAEITRYALLG